MSRSVGLSVFSSNFETRVAAPLDSRMLVDALADLHATATWQSGDGSYYAYKGMLVCVCNDTEENNGVYRLAALPYTTSSNWVKLGSGTGTGFTWYPDDTPPSVPEDGDVYYDTALGKSRVWSDDAWRTVANDGNDGAQGLPGEDGTDGITPHIDAGGNWFIGETDTGILAIGQDGEDGNDGTNGITPHIDETTGNWFIGETDTGIPAQGPAGEDGQDGINGTNGVTPHIGVNGNWFIGETDTGIPATGPAGTDGNDGAQGLPGDPVPLSDSSPAALGSATAGVSTSAARGDHVHPTTGLVLASEKGAVNGIASLGADGKVPASQLPESEGLSITRQRFARPYFEAATHLVVQAAHELDFSDAVTIIDTANVEADRAKVIAYNGAVLMACPETGFGGNFSGQPVRVDLSAITETCILRYKWVSAAGDSDWYVTFFPSNGEAYVAPPASSGGGGGLTADETLLTILAFS